MLKHLLIVSCLASALAGCITVSNDDGAPRVTVSPLITAGPDQSVVSKVQSAATQICGFVPAATTVLDIVTTFTGGGAIANLVEKAANGICSAVTSKGARRGATPKYRGVVIRGEFVRR